MGPISLQLRNPINESKIDCRVYRGAGKTFKQDDGRAKIAIVAHPYGPLGGSFDDPTVLLLVDTFLASGFDIVGTFNFRRPSWTLKPEIEDYSAVALFFLYYLSSTTRDTSLEHATMFMAGYSYGSLVASQVPQASEVATRLRPKAAERLLKQVYDIAAREKSPLREDFPLSDLSSMQLHTKYLLVSPLLSPTINLLAPLNRKTSLLGKTGSDAQGCPALAVFGSDDIFTSSNRLERWCADNNISPYTVDGASHFWQHSDHRHQLADSIEAWLKETD